MTAAVARYNGVVRTLTGRKLAAPYRPFAAAPDRRLRQARDKQEFDQFMADRRRMTPTSDAPQAS